jgi:thymidine phosphorylase
MTARLGQKIAVGDLLATLHHEDEDKADEAERIFRAACQLGDGDVAEPPLILEVHR